MNKPYLDVLGPLSSALMMLTLVSAVYFSFGNFIEINFFLQFYWVKLFAITVPIYLIVIIYSYYFYKNGIITKPIFYIIGILCSTTTYFLWLMVVSELGELAQYSNIFLTLYFQLLLLITVIAILTSTIRRFILRKMKN